MTCLAYSLLQWVQLLGFQQPVVGTLFPPLHKGGYKVQCKRGFGSSGHGSAVDVSICIGAGAVLRWSHRNKLGRSPSTSDEQRSSEVTHITDVALISWV